MLTAERIINETEQGKRIFLYLFPGSEECFEHKNKSFKIRQDERTASASYYFKGDRWRVTDFGDDGKAMDAIAAWCKVHGCDFHQATIQIGAAFNIVDELDPKRNAYDFQEEQAPEGMPDGSRPYKEKPFSTDELRLLSPDAREEDVKRLGWKCLERIGYVKDGKLLWFISTQGFPIFMRECPNPKGETFYKVYQPNNCDKARRFTYFPEGAKPARYTNGLEELKAEYRQLNQRRESEFRSVPGNEEKPFSEEKLPAAVICSGERDAICCRALGHSPVWFNSETYDISMDEMAEIKRYVETVYNIPDLDPTGIRRGSALALKFMDVRTVWLPAWLGQKTDHRGKARKDLRDWSDTKHTARSFEGLLEGAVCTDFLQRSWNEKKGCYTYSVMPTRLFEFLKLSGFHTLHDDNAKDARFIFIDNFIVREVLPREIAGYVIKWAKDHHLSEEKRDALINTRATGKLDMLDEIDPDFTTYGYNYQLFYTEDKCYKVTATEIKETTEATNYVWENKVIPHRIKLASDYFRIAKDGEGAHHWRIEVLRGDSPFFNYLINTSRLYWRKEMEERFKEDTGAAEAYARTHRFCIDGEGLAPEETAEQMQNLVSKIFTIGYLCHRHKEKSRAWAPIAMDNKVDEEGQCNGGTGKTVFFSVLSHYLRSLQLDGKQKDSDKDRHKFEQVDRHTDLIFVDDCNKDFTVEEYYSVITGEMPINVKHKTRFNLAFEDSPKIAFSTNYVPLEFSPSTQRRLIFLVFSDYYHAASEDNDYRETRKVSTDFGHDLYGVKYTHEEWQADLNFIMQCTRFYLSHMATNPDEPIQPPMDNIYLRRHMAVMGPVFWDWAKKYFAPDSGNLDREIKREVAFEAYRMDTKQMNAKMRGFTNRLKAFVKVADWVEEYNPANACNSVKDRRIIRREGDSIVEFFYIRSSVKPEQPQPIQQQIPF